MREIPSSQLIVVGINTNNTSQNFCLTLFVFPSSLIHSQYTMSSLDYTASPSLVIDEQPFEDDGVGDDPFFLVAPQQLHVPLSETPFAWSNTASQRESLLRFNQTPYHEDDNNVERYLMGSSEDDENGEDFLCSSWPPATRIKLQMKPRCLDAELLGVSTSSAVGRFPPEHDGRRNGNPSEALSTVQPYDLGTSLLEAHDNMISLRSSPPPFIAVRRDETAQFSPLDLDYEIPLR